MGVMNHLLASNPEPRMYVAVDLDDVLSCSSRRREHLDPMQTVLQLCHKAGQKQKQSNCKWFRNETEFYGVQINKEEVHTMNSMTEAVGKLPRPPNVREVQGFNGLTGCNHKLIHHYAHAALLLCQMCQLATNVQMRGQGGEPGLRDIGTVHVTLSGAAEEAFQTLKDAIIKAPMLALSEKRGMYLLHSAASKYSVGAVLSQKQQDGETRVIAICSGTFKSAEMQYPTYDREPLVIRDTVVDWRYYLHSDRHLMVRGDHASSRPVQTQPQLTAWQMEDCTTLKHIHMTSGASQAWWSQRLMPWWDVQS